jgi:hypothetical protein
MTPREIAVAATRLQTHAGGGMSFAVTEEARSVQSPPPTMLDSSSRIPRSAPIGDLEWEETTFTRPMRSPFAPEEPTAGRAPPAGAQAATPIDVTLEEGELFEAPPPRRSAPKPSLRRLSTAPPPRRTAAPPRFRDEETVKHDTPSWLLRVLASERDSARLRAAARTGEVVDLSKTVEEPTFEDE